MANAANKQAKIYDNQLKQSRRRGTGILKETPSGQNVLQDFCPSFGREIEWRKQSLKKYTPRR